MLKNKTTILLFAFVSFVISNVMSGIISGLIVYHYTNKKYDNQKNNIPIILKQNLKKSTELNESKSPFDLLNSLNI